MLIIKEMTTLCMNNYPFGEQLRCMHSVYASIVIRTLHFTMPFVL